MAKRKQTKPPAPPAPPKGDDKQPDPAAIPGAENRMATADETRKQEGNGQSAVGNGTEPDANASTPPAPAPAPPPDSASSAPSAVNSEPEPPKIGALAYRGTKKFVTKCAIVEDGLHYEKGRVIRLTAQRANQFGAEKLGLFKDEEYAKGNAADNGG